MSNGLKNIQSHARAHARRERLESGQPLAGYEDPDGAIGCLTPIEDEAPDQSYSSPEAGGPHSTPGGSSGSGASGSHFLHHHQHHSQAAAGYQTYGGYGHHHQAPTHHGHGYSNSVSSTGTAPGGYQQQSQGQVAGTGSQGASPYIGHSGRLPSVGDMGIDALINRGQGS
jgi:hypothetical protein